jgi:hypothetical protein
MTSLGAARRVDRVADVFPDELAIAAAARIEGDLGLDRAVLPAQAEQRDRFEDTCGRSSLRG